MGRPEEKMSENKSKQSPLMLPAQSPGKVCVWRGQIFAYLRRKHTTQLFFI